MSGEWTETVLHSFTSNGNDGFFPYGSLIFDTAGNLYGATGWGGAHKVYGTVFELTPGANGTWTEKILHSFRNGGKGGNSPEGLVFDSTGNLIRHGVCGWRHLGLHLFRCFRWLRHSFSVSAGREW